MCSTPLMAFSSGAATGGAISGYCAIGRLRIAARPAMTMKSDSTAAKMGRSMNRRENIVSPLFFRHGEGRLAAFRTLAHRLRRVIGLVAVMRRGDGHRRSGADFHHAVHDHLVSGIEARGDDPGVALPIAQLDRTRLGPALGVDDVDELALRPLEHRALRNHDS